MELLLFVKVTKLLQTPWKSYIFVSHVAIVCPTLSSITNGQVVYSTTSPFNYGTEATYTCDDGFGLTGGNRIRRCRGTSSSPNGVWSGSIPTCQGSQSLAANQGLELTIQFFLLLQRSPALA